MTHNYVVIYTRCAEFTCIKVIDKDERWPKSTNHIVPFEPDSASTTLVRETDYDSQGQAGCMYVST